MHGGGWVLASALVAGLLPAGCLAPDGHGQDAGQREHASDVLRAMPPHPAGAVVGGSGAGGEPGCSIHLLGTAEVTVCGAWMRQGDGRFEVLAVEAVEARGLAWTDLHVTPHASACGLVLRGDRDVPLDGGRSLGAVLDGPVAAGQGFRVCWAKTPPQPRQAELSFHDARPFGAAWRVPLDVRGCGQSAGFGVVQDMSLLLDEVGTDREKPVPARQACVLVPAGAGAWHGQVRANAWSILLLRDGQVVARAERAEGPDPTLVVEEAAAPALLMFRSGLLMGAEAWMRADLAMQDPAIRLVEAECPLVV